jgi:hypothetical protein
MRKNRFGIYWEIVIEGIQLTKCEYTQFISNNTSMWDEDGKALTNDQVLAAYKDSKKMPTTKATVLGQRS